MVCAYSLCKEIEIEFQWSNDVRSEIRGMDGSEMLKKRNDMFYFRILCSMLSLTS